MKKTRQHYVFRHYLKGWATNEQVWVLRQGRVFPASVGNVAVERYFYKLQELTSADIELVTKIGIEPLPPLLQSRCAEFIKMFTYPVELKKRLQAADPKYAELCSWLDEQIINVEEDYHERIEYSLVPALTGC